MENVKGIRKALALLVEAARAGGDVEAACAAVERAIEVAVDARVARALQTVSLAEVPRVAVLDTKTVVATGPAVDPTPAVGIPFTPSEPKKTTEF